MTFLVIFFILKILLKFHMMIVSFSSVWKLPQVSIKMLHDLFPKNTWQKNWASAFYYIAEAIEKIYSLLLPVIIIF